MAVGFGGKNAGIRWTPPLDRFAKAIQDLRDPVYDVVYSDLKPWVTTLRTQAQAGAPWQDQTGIARRGLFAYRRRGKSFMQLSLAHGPRTVSHHSPAWPNFRYGLFLETAILGGADEEMSSEDREWMLANDPTFLDNASRTVVGYDETGHGTLAIIMPTMEANYAAIMASFKGALVRAIKSQGVM